MRLEQVQPGILGNIQFCVAFFMTSETRCHTIEGHLNVMAVTASTVGLLDRSYYQCVI